MADRIQQRRDTKDRWAEYNPILLEGEPGYELDTDQYKLGDGVHAWNDLPYRGDPCLQQTGQSTTTPMSQKAVTDELNNLGKAVWPLTASFSASPSVIEYTGQAQETTLSWTVKRNGANATVTRLTVKQGSNNVYSGTANPGSQKVSVNTKGSTKYDLSATADGMTVTGSATVNAVLPMYFGFAAANAASGQQITSLGKQPLKTSPAGTYTLTNNTDGNYIWLCIPDTMTISRVTLNGFDVPMEAAQNSSTNLGGYKCYRSSNALVTGSYTIVIS